MDNTKRSPAPVGRPFNGKHYPRIKRVRTEPRQRIKQLLRSFMPLNPTMKNAQNNVEQ